MAVSALYRSFVYGSRISIVVVLMLFGSSCKWIELASVEGHGNTYPYYSYDPDLSADGRWVVYTRASSQPISDPAELETGVFARDLKTGAFREVGVDNFGDPVDYQNGGASISATGKYVAFVSSFSGIGSSRSQIYVRDHLTFFPTTTLISKSMLGAPAFGRSSRPEITGDGRYITYQSSAASLVPNDTNGKSDIFVHDSTTGSTERVSLGSGGVQANDHSQSPSISDDGMLIVFESTATNLATNDINGVSDVFLHNRSSGSTTRLSALNTGVGGSGSSDRAVISADGDFIAFRSEATNLVADDTNDDLDIFLHKNADQTITRVSIASNGAQANGNSSIKPSISGDGRYIVFGSQATNLVEQDFNNSRDIFLHDTVTRLTSRVSTDAAGNEANSSSSPFDKPVISADGRYAAFSTWATNLVPNDNNYETDVLVSAIPVVTVSSVVPDHIPIDATTSVTIYGANFFSGAMPVVQGEITNVVVVDENTITADITVPAGLEAGARIVAIKFYGTGPGLATGATGYCDDCLTYQ